jgi:hypothetical protein
MERDLMGEVVKIFKKGVDLRVRLPLHRLLIGGAKFGVS